MFNQFKNPKIYLMLFTDAVLFIIAYVGAYLLRFEFVLRQIDVEQILLVLPYLIPAKLAVFCFLGFTGACGDSPASKIPGV